MTSNRASEGEKNRLEFWRHKWEINLIGFHNSEVHHLLKRHMDKVFEDGKPSNIFVPLCGKTLDMTWFADQGILTVGLDGVQTALEQFYTEHGLEWEETRVPSLGPSGNLLSSKDGSFKLFCGDMMDFNKDVAGTFDAIWDRGSISALNRVDVPRYVDIIKSVLKPGGRILVEVTEYDVAIMADNTRPTKPPPPHPMTEKDLKALYEPECSVQFLDRDACKLVGKDIHMALYLIVKK